MEGPFFCNLMEPFDTTTQSQLTLTTTAQTLYTNDQLPNLGGYFNYAGKALHFRGVGVCTSGATPGNFGFSVYFGANTSGLGTLLCSVSYTWTASVANATFMFDFTCKCRLPGSSGTLVCEGFVFNQGAGIIQCQYSAPVVATGINLLSATSCFISPQVFRSGTTAETAQAYDIFFESLN